MTTSVSRRRVEHTDESASVTPLELFFDLVFVYAITQVTGLLAAHPDVSGALRAVVVLGLVWWCWVGYSWLGNYVRADEGLTRAAFIAVMAIMFVVAITIPESFSDLPGGLPAPMVIPVCYIAVRLIHIGLFVKAGRQAGDRELAIQVLKFTGVMAVAAIPLVIGGLSDPDRRVWLWALVIVIDFLGTGLLGAGDWRVPAPGHFVERHGLIIIIALGESLVSIGVGVTALPVSWPIVAGTVVGIVLAATLWWVYFDVTYLVIERLLAERAGADRAALARDCFSFIHFPMIAGIVIMALGLKKALHDIGESGVIPRTAELHDWTTTLHGLPQLALHLGPAIFLAALVVFRIRAVGTMGRSRPLAIAALVATIPLGMRSGALVNVALVTAILIGLVAWEAVAYREFRHRIRHAGHDHD